MAWQKINPQVFTQPSCSKLPKLRDIIRKNEQAKMYWLEKNAERTEKINEDMKINPLNKLKENSHGLLCVRNVTFKVRAEMKLYTCDPNDNDDKHIHIYSGKITDSIFGRRYDGPVEMNFNTNTKKFDLWITQRLSGRIHSTMESFSPGDAIIKHKKDGTFVITF